MRLMEDNANVLRIEDAPATPPLAIAGFARPASWPLEPLPAANELPKKASLFS